MFEQSFKNIDDILHKDAGCGSELDYVEQTSWILFLKYLDDLEKDKENAALLSGDEYSRLIEYKFQSQEDGINELGGDVIKIKNFNQN
jgi:type I restriction enzyme M protein